MNASHVLYGYISTTTKVTTPYSTTEHACLRRQPSNAALKICLFVFFAKARVGPGTRLTWHRHRELLGAVGLLVGVTLGHQAHPIGEALLQAPEHKVLRAVHQLFAPLVFAFTCRGDGRRTTQQMCAGLETSYES